MVTPGDGAGRGVTLGREDGRADRGGWPCSPTEQHLCHLCLPSDLCRVKYRLKDSLENSMNTRWIQKRHETSQNNEMFQMFQVHEKSKKCPIGCACVCVGGGGGWWWQGLLYLMGPMGFCFLKGCTNLISIRLIFLQSTNRIIRFSPLGMRCDVILSFLRRTALQYYLLILLS